MKTSSRLEILQELNLRYQALAATDNRGFKKEFGELNKVGKDLPTKAGDSEANRGKNRYPSILPYDHCRVRLSIQNQNPHSDYINANFVPGGGSERDFICTQGPLPNTTADFWRMVWEQNVRIIIMLTSLQHKNMVLCNKYWPLEPGSVLHGLIQVTTVTRKQVLDYFITTINLRQRGYPTNKIITHYHYPSWPDQGVPNPSSLCGFTEHVRQHLEGIPHLGPAVVHCSAGVGRSGTFATLLWLMQLCVRGIQADVRAAVMDMRLHRMWMVQTLATNFDWLYSDKLVMKCQTYAIREQYMFIYQCLIHWMSGGASASGTQTQGAGTNATQRIRDKPHSSSGQRDRSERRQHHHQQQKTLPEQPQNTIQQILQPGNLLRRLLPSLSTNQGPHSS